MHEIQKKLERDKTITNEGCHEIWICAWIYYYIVTFKFCIVISIYPLVIVKKHQILMEKWEFEQQWNENDWYSNISNRGGLKPLKEWINIFGSEWTTIYGLM